MLVTLLGISMLVSPKQPENALSPMLVTLLGIVTFLKFGELSKHHAGISVIPSGRTSSSKPVRLNAACSKVGAPKIAKVLKLLHSLNASAPMLVTLLGISMLVRPEQPENA